MGLKDNKLSLPVWVYILNSVDGKKSKSDIAHELGITYSHVADVCSTLSESGLVIQTKVGRKAILSLTNRGNDLQINCMQLISAIQ